MEITIEKLLEGKSTAINGNEYLETKEYTLPFIDLMSRFTKDFYCFVEVPKQVTFTNKQKDITYNRVWVQAVMSTEHDIDGHAETYNLVYGLDMKKPVYKVFKAYKNRRSGNLFVFNSQWLNVYELKPGQRFTNLEPTIKNLMSLTDDSQIRFRKLNKTFLSSDPNEKSRTLGDLFIKCMLTEFYGKGGKVKLATNIVLKAFQNVYMNSSSKYYINDTKECSLFNYINSFLTLIIEDRKGDPVTIFERCYLCLELFDNGEICR